METIKAKWTGIRPLLMHNGQMADPLNEWVLLKKEITSKPSKKRTEADYIELDRIQWMGGVYWDDKDGLIIPADNIERCVQLGGMKSRIGNDIKAALFCVDGAHSKVNHKGPKSIEAIRKDPAFTIRRGVVVNKQRVMSVRPLIPTGWSIEVNLEFDPTILNRSAVEKAMTEAGALVGLGDWRPKFGRFTVEIL